MPLPPVEQGPSASGSTEGRDGQPRRWVAVALTFAAYLAAVQVGLELATVHANVSPIWPATGVALAAMLHFGPRVWMGIAAGAFLGNFLTGLPLAAAAGIACGNTLEAWVGSRVVLFVRERGELLGSCARPTGFLSAALVAPLVAAGVGAATLVAAGAVPSGLAFDVAITWWAGDAIGALVLAPLLLVLLAAMAGRRTAWRGVFEPVAGAGESPDDLRPTGHSTWLRAARIAAILLLSLVTASAELWPGMVSGLHFLAFPVVFLGALWFGRLGALTTSCLNIVLILAATHLSTTGFARAFDSDISMLELFLGAVAVTALFLGEVRRASVSWVPACVLLSGWALSGWIFGALQENGLEFDRLRMERLVDEAGSAIERRMATYIDALHGGVSLYAASEGPVTLTEWRAYAESLDVVDRYPGINGIGVISPVAGDELAAFTAQVRGEGQVGFSPHPVPGVVAPQVPDVEDEHFIIKFIEPVATNAKAVGLDIGSESNRRSAARSACDTGLPTITDTIVLVQDGKHRPGFLLLLPVYRNGTLPRDLAGGRRELLCWVYAPFITEVFLAGVLGDRREIDLDFHNGPGSGPDTLLYTTRGDVGPVGEAEVRTQLELGGRPFTLDWRRTADFATTGQGAAMLSGASLAMISVLFAGLILSLQTLGRRARRLADRRTLELQHANRELGRQIAERQRAQDEAERARTAAEVASRAKGEFLATMSHEIRTPMNSVIGFTDLLLQSQLTDEQRQWAAYTRTAGHTLLTLINDVLDYSKIEAGRMSLESAPFSPVEATGTVIGLMRHAAEEKRLELVLEVSSEPPRAMLGDPVRFTQVLLNLISNAIKFTPAGEVRVRLDYVPDDERRGALGVTVTDTGIGIPAEALPRLFDEFSQADGSTTRRFGGTGLGLAISKRLVELMGGSISIVSEVDRGSEVRVDLPVALATCEPAGGEPAGSPAPGSASWAGSPSSPAAPGAGFPEPLSMHVLLVEDVVMNQVLARKLLERMGVTVEVAENGAVAVERCDSEHFDLILMDCQMPVLDGFEAATTIREHERRSAGGGDGRRVPIVALTARALEGDRERCLDAGMDDYLTKPIRPAELELTLRRWATAPTA